MFETDQFAPLIELGEELSGRRYGEDYPTDRALRMLADHTRAMTFLIADGVVPSNEDRGYVLRRIMRRAIQQGRRSSSAPASSTCYADRVTEIMGAEYAELHEQRDSIQKWLESEEEGFGRTLEQGLKRLDELIERARDTGAEGIAAADAFLPARHLRLPDRPDARARRRAGLGVDEQGFEVLMDEQRERARAGAGRFAGGEDAPRAGRALNRHTGFATDFVGYETTDAETTIGAAESENGRVLVKLVESPFYATGGGQVADSGYVECLEGDCRARVEDVLRIGNDQVLAVVPERGTIEPGRAGARARRPRGPPRDRVQPHRDAPAPRGAAPAPGHARAAGRLVRRPRQAALRLHPRQGAHARGARWTSRTR